MTRIGSKSHFQFKRVRFLFDLEDGSGRLPLYIWVHYITTRFHACRSDISGGLSGDLYIDGAVEPVLSLNPPPRNR